MAQVLMMREAGPVGGRQGPVGDLYPGTHLRGRSHPLVTPVAGLDYRPAGRVGRVRSAWLRPWLTKAPAHDTRGAREMPIALDLCLIDLKTAKTATSLCTG